jgi:D-alanyl-D-alanine dipeptidase
MARDRKGSMPSLFRIIGARQPYSAAAALVVAVLSLGAGPGRVAGQDADAPAARRALPAPLVHLRDVDASILQDMRYAGYDNFTGAPVPGYGAAECILTRRTAQALASVQSELAARRLSLKVYDCYRPLKAVAAFMRWVGSAADDGNARFHPSLPRGRLVALGYIAARSGHSRGNTVDLTLVALPRREVPPFVSGQDYGPCTAGADARAPDDGVDMGTGFDCFDTMSHAGAAQLSAAQKGNRRTLTEAMTRAGFVAYDREWWHFSYPPGDPGRAFDVDVVPRR